MLLQLKRLAAAASQVVTRLKNMIHKAHRWAGDTFMPQGGKVCLQALPELNQAPPEKAPQDSLTV